MSAAVQESAVNLIAPSTAISAVNNPNALATFTLLFAVIVWESRR